MDECDLNGSRNKPTQHLFDAKELRMNAELMQVISRSQDRCLDLWYTKPEPHMKHPEFLAVIKRTKIRGTEFTSSQILLYDKLARWREYVALKEECLAGFVCPLEFLVTIAHMRPTTQTAMRRLSYFLPELLEEKSRGDYVGELLELVSESRAADGLDESDESFIGSYFAGGCHLDEEEKQDRSSSGSSSNRWVVVAGVVACVSAIAVTVFAARRRR
jgi:hypothetical protein